MVLVLGACTTTPSPTASPRASVTAVASAPAVPSASPSAAPTPLSVLESEEADALFRQPDTCRNPEITYSVTFPDDWYTNTAIGDQAACTWFTPDFFEVGASGEMPEEIWIRISLVEGLIGYNMLTQVERSDDVRIDGYAGHRAEFRTLEDINDTVSDRLTYQYVVPFDTSGPTLVASTSVDMAGDYELAKAVLDRIMVSMEIDRLIAVAPRIPHEPTGPLISGDPVRAEDVDGSFRLTLEADQDRYRAGQEIGVMATLTYLGQADGIVALGSSNPGLIGFAVEREDIPVGVSPAFTTDCGPHEMRRGVPVEYPLVKSGGFSPDEPLAPFYEAYFASPELRLPPGTWTISAGGSWYTGGDCGDVLHSLGASVTVVVVP